MHSRHSGTQALKAPEGHVRTPTLRVLGHLVHSGTQVALGNLGTQGTWARKALGHSKDTLALGHSRHLGTWPLKVLEVLYLADSFRKSYFYINKVRASFLIFNILTIKNFHDESCPQSCIVFSFILKVLWFVNIWSNSSPPFR